MIIKLKDGVEYVKAMIVALIKVGNAIKVDNAKYTTSTVDVAQSYFVGIVLRSSIKVSTYFLNFDFLK
jgi:hypothetical protein